MCIDDDASTPCGHHDMSVVHVHHGCKEPQEGASKYEGDYFHSSDIQNPHLTKSDRKLLQQKWMDIDAENFPSVDDVGASSRACRDPGPTTATCGVAADLRDLGHLSDG